MYNYHTHTCFCDGSSNPKEYVLEAICQGFSHLGFSAHAPVEFDNSYALRIEKTDEYFNIIKGLKQEFQQEITILNSLEIDFIPDQTIRFQSLVNKYQLDYTIGSVHLVKSSENQGLWFIDGGKSETYDQGLQDVFHGDIKAGVSAYYKQVQEMIMLEKPSIVGHFDKINMHNKGRYFSSQERWYQDLVHDTLDIIAQSNVIIEVNSRGLYKKRYEDFFPETFIIEAIKQRGIPLTISTDAHSPKELTLFFREAEEKLLELGFSYQGKINDIYILKGTSKN